MTRDELVDRLDEVDAFISIVDGDEMAIVYSTATEEKAQSILNAYKAETGTEIDIIFNDEIIYCDTCGEYERIQNMTGFVSPHGFYACGACIDKDEEKQDDYFDYLINNPNAYNRRLPESYLLEQGFSRATDNEGNPIVHSFGMYGHEDGIVPEKCLSDGNDIIFYVTEHNPFTTEYGYWIRKTA